jgi:hypothetical protein
MMMSCYSDFAVMVAIATTAVLAIAFGTSPAPRNLIGLRHSPDGFLNGIAHS